MVRPKRLIDVNEHLLVRIAACGLGHVFHDRIVELLDFGREVVRVLVLALAKPFAAQMLVGFLHGTHGEIGFVLVVLAEPDVTALFNLKSLALQVNLKIEINAILSNVIWPVLGTQSVERNEL